VLVHVSQQAEQRPRSGRRFISLRLGPRLTDILPYGLRIGARPLLQQIADRRIAVADQMVAPGFRTVLPGAELPGLVQQRLDCLGDRRGVAAPEQLGNVLQLPLAGNVGADLTCFVYRGAAIRSRASDLSSSASRRRWLLLMGPSDSVKFSLISGIVFNYIPDDQGEIRCLIRIG